MGRTVGQFLLTAAALTTILPSASPYASHNTNASHRRAFLQSIAPPTAALLTLSHPANANYGDSSKIVLPNYIEYLIEKNQQVNPNDLLYKGPDLELQLRRIGEVANRLPEVATLAEEKRWSQVQGIITGPLGTLLQTMNSLAGTKAAKDAARLVKNDLIEIGVAAGRKESGNCVKAAKRAGDDLERFVMLL